MARTEVVVTADGQRAVQRTLEKLQQEVVHAAQQLEQAELRLNRFKKFIDEMSEAEREKLLACFQEIEEALEDSGQEVI
ncbi:MAG: hypothetical protein HYW07_10305 [Candidatus Latescibacteria bacterium]|nr:hypothetical protein [Candidatus Latescibacterota bacterium]